MKIGAKVFNVFVQVQNDKGIFNYTDEYQPKPATGDSDTAVVNSFIAEADEKLRGLIGEGKARVGTQEVPVVFR